MRYHFGEPVNMSGYWAHTRAHKHANDTHTHTHYWIYHITFAKHVIYERAVRAAMRRMQTYEMCSGWIVPCQPHALATAIEHTRAYTHTPDSIHANLLPACWYSNTFALASVTDSCTYYDVYGLKHSHDCEYVYKLNQLFLIVYAYICVYVICVYLRLLLLVHLHHHHHHLNYQHTRPTQPITHKSAHIHNWRYCICYSVAEQLDTS